MLFKIVVTTTTLLTKGLETLTLFLFQAVKKPIFPCALDCPSYTRTLFFGYVCYGFGLVASKTRYFMIACSVVNILP